MYRAIFSNKVVSPVSTGKPKPAVKKPHQKLGKTAAIKINNQTYVPAHNKTNKPLVVDGVTYVPVKIPAPTRNITRTITPTKQGKIDTFKIGEITYIPIKVIPKDDRKIFNPFTAPKVIININGNHYVPITDKTVKPVVVDGKTYIPVKVAPESANKTNAIVPKKTGPIDTFKIGNTTFIPMNVIPKVFRPLFKTKIPTKAPTKGTPVITINGKNYVPIKN